MAKVAVFFALLICTNLVSCKRPFKARDYSAYPRSARVEEKKVEAKKDDGYGVNLGNDEKEFEKSILDKPLGEKPEYKPDNNPFLKEEAISGEKPGLDAGYKPGKLPELETGIKPEAGGYKPDIKPDLGFEKPDYKPDIQGEKPDVKPDLSIGKPVYKPEIELGKPDYKPGVKPEIELGKPDYKPGVKPEIELGKPDYKPEFGKPGIGKPGLGKPGFDISPNVFPPKRPYVPKLPPRPILPPKRPTYGCGFAIIRQYPPLHKKPGVHQRKPFPSFVYRFFGSKKKPDIPIRPVIEKPGYDKPKPIFETKPLLEPKPDYNKPGIIPLQPVKNPDVLGKPQLYGKPGNAYGNGIKEIKEIKEVKESVDLIPKIKEENKYPPFPSQTGRGYYGG